MNKFFVILYVLIISSGCVSAEKENTKPKSITYIPQTETPYDNGQKHGTLLKEEVRFQIKNWEEGITAHLNIDRDSIRKIVYEHTGFLSAIKQHTPELLNEINGIADGAGLDRELVLYFNLGEEIFNFCTSNFESCSNIAFQEDHGAVLAYNQDLPDFLHGENRPIILDHKTHYVFTMPGSIALSGASQHLAVSCNSLPMLNMNTQGLPLPFYIRKLLQVQSLRDAQQYIERTPMAIAQNLMLVSHTGIRNAEISKNQIKWMSSDTLGYYYHTNFPIENTDYKQSDYLRKDCDRYNFFATAGLKSNSDNITSVLEELCAMHPIKNRETYLRFIATYKSNTKPSIKFINPNSQESILLKF